MPHALWFITCLFTSAACLATLTASASASLIITAQESGSDVVFSYTGSIDLASAGAPDTGSSAGQFINPSIPSLSFRIFSSPQGDRYSLPSHSWSVFGSGNATTASSSSGDILRLFGGTQITLPSGYVSNAPLSGTMTFVGQSFSSLGITPGDYVWDLQFTGGPGQTATISVVPEPSTVYGLLAFLAMTGSAKLLRNKQSH